MAATIHAVIVPGYAECERISVFEEVLHHLMMSYRDIPVIVPSCPVFGQL